MRLMALVLVVLLAVMGMLGCEPPSQSDESGPWHHECPVAAPVRCQNMLPEYFDAPAECAKRVPGSQACPFQGRMCASDGCDNYPPESATFIEWFLCDGEPVELWCCSAGPGSQ